ncbi:phosphomannomutase [Candidatus Kuenenia stuttgartiensis]|nr:phosphomannomutase [Candidatus Kuenenia stuttgartiensis]MBE7546124.1 phosphomannomutase [Planctomycetia bacterium]
MAHHFKNAEECWRAILSDVKGNAGLLSEIKKFAEENTAPAKIVFGTSGWRGEMGTDYTFHTVRIVTTAIIEMFKNAGAELLGALGAENFGDIKKHGIIVGHDNRFLGPEFANAVMGLLSKEGIRVYYADEATTPELSASVEMVNAAGSINLTPSHNPANYAGFKFNPADGGPAGTEITSVIERNANQLMANNKTIPAILPGDVEKIDTIKLYKDFLLRRGTLDIEKIRRFIQNEDCFICIDHVHGASRKRPASILGESNKISYLRTEDDYLFGGISPEPSARNIQPAMDMLKGRGNRFKLGVVIDPDGDRIRFTDGNRDITINHFGATALHFLHTYKNIFGVLVKSVATSNFGNAIAQKLSIPVKETAVGFKNFRPYMLQKASERAIVAYEESDGITGYNNTLEKDALFGLLIAIEMMAVTGKNISEYLCMLEEEFGAYYPERAGIEVARSLAGEPLAKKLSKLLERFKTGEEFLIGEKKKKIASVITTDGIKIVLDDNSWFLIRPSGTEPKVRFYTETRSQCEAAAMIDAVKSITKEALE